MFLLGEAQQTVDVRGRYITRGEDVAVPANDELHCISQDDTYVFLFDALDEDAKIIFVVIGACVFLAQ